MATDQNSCITISEFINLTAISEQKLISLLENGQLEFTKNSSGQLLIDIAELTAERLASYNNTPRNQIDETSTTLLQETIASEIVSALDDIIAEAFTMALRWRKAGVVKINDEPLAKTDDSA